uniref:Uncharacterized protein n=1 Tax=Spermophilus dauricus TaxID=99837 RepID=A0A8C9QL05_SPEDA
MSAPETPAGEGIPGHLCCQSKCCCARGHPASCWDRLLCCAARAVFVCMVWGFCPRAFFSPVTTVRDSPCVPTAPFSTHSRGRCLPSPVNVDICILLCNLGPPPRRPSSQAL